MTGAAVQYMVGKTPKWASLQNAILRGHFALNQTLDDQEHLGGSKLWRGKEIPWK